MAAHMVFVRLIKYFQGLKVQLKLITRFKAAVRLGVISQASQEYAKHSCKIISRISAGSSDKVLIIPVWKLIGCEGSVS
jgi:hypothetical protein